MKIKLFFEYYKNQYYKDYACAEKINIPKN